MKTLVSRYDKKMIGQLPKVLFKERIIIIQSEFEAKKAVEYLLQQEIIGIDTETKPVFQKGRKMNPVALLQIATENTCFLFRLNLIGLTDDIIRLFTHKDIIRVGLSLKDDLMQLSRRRHFVPGEFVEIQKMVTEIGIKDQSLQKIYANLFGRQISKSQQLTNWEADALTEAQKRYAATDAWACIKIYKELLELDASGYMLEIIPEPEQPVTQTLTMEELEAKKERMKEKEREKRRRKRQKDKIKKQVGRMRKDKDMLKSIE